MAKRLYVFQYETSCVLKKLHMNSSHKKTGPVV